MSTRPAPRRRHNDEQALRKGDRRLRALLVSLEDQLAERAISDLSVEDIAAGAGVSRSSFYFYFESKHAALTSAVATVRETMVGAAGPFFEPGDAFDPHDAIRESLRGIAELWHQHRRLLAAIVEATAHDPDVAALWERWITDFIDLVHARIATEQAAGRALAAPPGPRELAVMLLWANERNLYMAHRREEVDLEKLVDDLTALWIRSIYGAR